MWGGQGAPDIPLSFPWDHNHGTSLSPNKGGYLVSSLSICWWEWRWSYWFLLMFLAIKIIDYLKFSGLELFCFARLPIPSIWLERTDFLGTFFSAYLYFQFADFSIIQSGVYKAGKKLENSSLCHFLLPRYFTSLSSFYILPSYVLLTDIYLFK